MGLETAIQSTRAASVVAVLETWLKISSVLSKLLRLTPVLRFTLSVTKFTLKMALICIPAWSKALEYICCKVAIFWLFSITPSGHVKHY